MNIVGKLFGSLGPVAPDENGIRSDRAATACPGFCWWYSLQMAKSYEAASRRASDNVVSLFGQALRRELPLAA